MSISPSLPVRPLNSSSLNEVYVPSCPDFNFEAASVEIEGAAGSGVGVQFPFEDHPQRRHSHVMRIGAMYVDKHPVTNSQYATYLKASGYRPADAANWLVRSQPINKSKNFPF